MGCKIRPEIDINLSRITGMEGCALKILDEQRRRAAAQMPGVMPCVTPDWITVDADYSAQLATKATVLSKHESAVLQVQDSAIEAVEELRALVVDLLSARLDFTVLPDQITRPDGFSVSRDQDPFVMLSQLLQEDLCVLQKHDGEHVLTAALLCFPAGWTLSEKIGRPLMAIHSPVESYTADIAKRVQRLFDGVQEGRPMWRANLLQYADSDLHQPHREADPRPISSEKNKFERSERQTLIRLPQSRAVVFAIHTTVASRCTRLFSP